MAEHDYKLIGDFQVLLECAPDHYRAVIREGGMHMALTTGKKDLSTKEGRRSALSELQHALSYSLRQWSMPEDTPVYTEGASGLHVGKYPDGANGNEAIHLDPPADSKQ